MNQHVKYIYLGILSGGKIKPIIIPNYPIKTYKLETKHMFITSLSSCIKEECIRHGYIRIYKDRIEYTYENVQPLVARVEP